MGRLGDADVHAAFVEFRAKETDKCLSAQCIYCQAVRAKNTSRQRQHLLECPNYLNAMKEHNPANPILELAANGTPTPAMKVHKKRKLESGEAIVSSPGFQGDSFGTRALIPPPQLERDFQIFLQMNPRVDIGPAIWGDQFWTSIISGHWNGRWGKGSIAPGGQDEQRIAKDLSTNVSGRLVLQTHDHPSAQVVMRYDGWRVGPRDVLDKLLDPAQTSLEVDPKSYSYRIYIHMESGDARYLHLNTGMWIGSCMRRGTELITDAYRVS